jgi:hypothetical protein
MSDFPALIQDGRFLKTRRMRFPLGLRWWCDGDTGAHGVWKSPWLGKGKLDENPAQSRLIKTLYAV